MREWILRRVGVSGTLELGEIEGGKISLRAGVALGIFGIFSSPGL